MLQLYSNRAKDIYKKVSLKYANGPHSSRFLHIEGVCKLATLLAKKYGADIEKAQIASLLHDYYKYESDEELEKHIDSSDLEECRRYNVLYHSYASANSLKNEFMIDDNDIYNAIRNHVFGRLNMSLLEKIILVSDYCEEGREYKDCIDCRKILLEKGIDYAIYFSTKKVISFLEERGIKPHPLQYEILEKYKEFQ